jgi:hypothetical protein
MIEMSRLILLLGINEKDSYRFRNKDVSKELSVN